MVVLSSLESYLVLQLLSALELFAVVFAILAAPAAEFALLTVALDCALLNWVWGWDYLLGFCAAIGEPNPVTCEIWKRSASNSTPT